MNVLGPGYPFRFISQGPLDPSGLLLEMYLCPFRTRSGEAYIAQVEKYAHHVYVVKFYLKRDRNTRDPEQRFQRQTNVGAGEAIRIIHTCFRVMLYVIERDPLASCGFIGTPKPTEDKATTQRYRIYVQMMRNFFSATRFEHREFPAESAFLLLNRAALARDPDLLRHAAAMFDALYLMPGGLYPPAGPPEPAGVG